MSAYIVFDEVRRGVFMAISSALASGSSGPGLSPGRGHCFVFLDKISYFSSASLNPEKVFFDR